MTEDELSQISKILWGIANQFRGVTKLIAYAKARSEWNASGIWQFSTQCEENLGEVPA